MSSSQTSKRRYAREQSMKAKTQRMTIKATHPGSIVQKDDSGVWVDLLTLSINLGFSPYTWSSRLLKAADQHFGGRHVFKRTKGRQALWNLSVIAPWFRARELQPDMRQVA